MWKRRIYYLPNILVLTWLPTPQGVDAMVDEYGTKLCRMVEEVRSLGEGERCVIFSAWGSLLHLAGASLAASGIGHALLRGSTAST